MAPRHPPAHLLAIHVPSATPWTTHTPTLYMEENLLAYYQPCSLLVAIRRNWCHPNFYFGTCTVAAPTLWCNDFPLPDWCADAKLSRQVPSDIPNNGDPTFFHCLPFRAYTRAVMLHIFKWTPFFTPPSFLPSSPISTTWLPPAITR